MLRVLDLFSGIGGFSLGLERTGGFRTVAFCEIDLYCRAVLARHWPRVPIFEDICELDSGRFVADAKFRHCLQEREISAGRKRAWACGIDIICGGFPCQDISVAGKGAGLAGERSGLWREYHRLIGELRPRYVIVENVSALLSRGLGTVLGDLASIGYDAEWHCIPASYVGAPHRRDRVWVVASPALADSDAPQCAGNECSERSRAKYSNAGGSSWWASEPNVGRVAHGVPARVDRLRALGNAVVPQVVEMIGRAILQAEAA